MDLVQKLKKLAACEECTQESDRPTAPAQGEMYGNGAELGEVKDIQVGPALQRGQAVDNREAFGMSMGQEMPADSAMIEMIRQDPEASAHYQMAVDKVVHNFKNMKTRERINVATQGDMAQMFNDPSMSGIGAFEGGFMDEARAGQYPMGEEAAMPAVDEEGNPIDEKSSQEEMDETAQEEGAEGETLPEGEEKPEGGEEGEEEEDMYPFGQREKKPKAKKEGEEEPEEEKKKEEPEEKTASVKYNSLLDALKDLLVK